MSFLKLNPSISFGFIYKIKEFKMNKNLLMLMIFFVVVVVLFWVIPSEKLIVITQCIGSLLIPFVVGQLAKSIREMINKK